MRARMLTLFYLLFCFGNSLSQDQVVEECLDCFPASYKKAIADNTFQIKRAEATDGKCPNRMEFLEPALRHCCSDSIACNTGHKSECISHWLYENNKFRCDYFISNLCPKQSCCGCCIDCGDEICSDCLHTDGATCRKTCMRNEYAIDVPCHSGYCQCCKRCKIEQSCKSAGGFCVSHPSFCNWRDYYPYVNGCSGGCCYCCRPILTKWVSVPFLTKG
ncbi:uncharacterized protein LOC122254273 [Penaeus japonicus]|uniref:uncharacterized protein LOC122254273 n=1 Tax=Penaeus japonicus TaxID=27405 RepID=UPI001C70E48E|nr:uncharacterized protein LOC122254273 [Penaeus japonicus]XP_042873813.1 uncharacterized protein LOC122254273 [Penaeus japonicus]XP_042873814.1 uncharacterized protein LOC122254273 [Penaeus japonicus]XP_042873816.1 uncharacterized protein LOC122254273 [Penaeus japonicus]